MSLYRSRHTHTQEPVCQIAELEAAQNSVSKFESINIYNRVSISGRGNIFLFSKGSSPVSCHLISHSQQLLGIDLPKMKVDLPPQFSV